MQCLSTIHNVQNYLTVFKGHFDLHQSLHVCQTCQHQWTPDLKDLLRSGYWPASVTSSTLYTLDLLNSFQELKVISPGFSRQAFAKLLEHRTKIGGRVSVIVITTLKNFFPLSDIVTRAVQRPLEGQVLKV